MATITAEQKKIEREIERLQKKAQALQDKQRAPVLAKILRDMREFEISPQEISEAYEAKAKGIRKTAGKSASKGTKPTAKPAGVVPPKYRHPETGDTWTGRGKAPRWVTEAEASGTARDTFLIAKPAAPAASDAPESPESTEHTTAE